MSLTRESHLQGQVRGPASMLEYIFRGRWEGGARTSSSQGHHICDKGRNKMQKVSSVPDWEAGQGARELWGPCPVPGSPGRLPLPPGLPFHKGSLMGEDRRDLGFPPQNQSDGRAILAPIPKPIRWETRWVQRRCSPLRCGASV